MSARCGPIPFVEWFDEVRTLAQDEVHIYVPRSRGYHENPVFLFSHVAILRDTCNHERRILRRSQVIGIPHVDTVDPGLTMVDWYGEQTAAAHAMHHALRTQTARRTQGSVDRGNRTAISFAIFSSTRRH